MAPCGRFFAPDMLKACELAVRNGVRDLDFFRVQRNDFASCPSDSIDYAVMEKLGRHPECGISGYVVPLDAGWSDLGAWDAVWPSLKKMHRATPCLAMQFSKTPETRLFTQPQTGWLCWSG